VPGVGLVNNYHFSRGGGFHLPKDIQRVVLRTVVEEDELVFDAQGVETGVPLANHSFNGGSLIVDRDDYRKWCMKGSTDRVRMKRNDHGEGRKMRKS
jgi:hypothetical protein